MEDWTLAIAGQRVQVIKKHPKLLGILQFGTEVITSKDGSIACLLGASPGASTAVSIMLELIQDCFSDKLKTLPWQTKLQEMIPSYGQSLIKNAPLAERVTTRSREVLGLREAEAVLS
jgi:malate dehydrogenase (quinone)